MPAVKVRKYPHNIPFDSLPEALIEQHRETVRPRGFVSGEIEHSKFDLLQGERGIQILEIRTPLRVEALKVDGGRWRALAAQVALEVRVQLIRNGGMIEKGGKTDRELSDVVTNSARIRLEVEKPRVRVASLQPLDSRSLFPPKFVLKTQLVVPHLESTSQMQFLDPKAPQLLGPVQPVNPGKASRALPLDSRRKAYAPVLQVARDRPQFGGEAGDRVGPVGRGGPGGRDQVGSLSMSEPKGLETEKVGRRHEREGREEQWRVIRRRPWEGPEGGARKV